MARVMCASPRSRLSLGPRKIPALSGASGRHLPVNIVRLRACASVAPAPCWGDEQTKNVQCHARAFFDGMFVGDRVNVQVVAFHDRLAGLEEQSAWPTFSMEEGRAEQEQHSRPVQSEQKMGRPQQLSKREGARAKAARPGKTLSAAA